MNGNADYSHAKGVEGQLREYAALFEKVAQYGVGKHERFPSPVILLDLGRNVVRYCPTKIETYLELLANATEVRFFDWENINKQRERRIDEGYIMAQLGLGNLEGGLKLNHGGIGTLVDTQ